MSKRWIILTAALAAVLAAGCSGEGEPAGSAGGTAAQGRVLRVVATTTQVADLAANVGGDRVQVTSLLKPGIDAHDYEPSPADLQVIARADWSSRTGSGWRSGWPTPSTAPDTTAPWLTRARAWPCARSRVSPIPTSGRTPATPW